jgi:hypothetical protein
VQELEIRRHMAVITELVRTAGALANAGTAHRTATTQPPGRRTFAAGLTLAVALVVAAIVGLTAHSAPRTVADICTGTFANGAASPACIPGLSGGSVSAGAPSEGLITAKNWCNLVIGGCSSAFFYPPGPASLPNVDNTVRHSP